MLSTKRMLTSCFGLGFMPFASGTWGSIPPVIIFYIFYKSGLPPIISAAVFGLLAIFFSFFCIHYCEDAIKHTGKKDPSEVVADEFAGQSVTLFFACFLAFENIYIFCILTLLLFRFFDITKFWPANRLEKLSGGTGILLDDIMAGVYAGLVMLSLYLPDWQNAFNNIEGQTLNVLSAGILGIVQGLTEFLPVSSSGHLVLFEELLPDVNPDSPQMLMFDLAIHVATVLAILAYYHKSIFELIKNLFHSGKYGKTPVAIYKKSPSVRLLFLAVITTMVTGIGYFLFKDPLESARKLEIVAFMWIVTATLLLITDMRIKTRIGLRDFGIFASIIVGIAQTAAILPGISRSGATICTAILLGLHRRWAIEYSFLIAIPAILAGAGLKLLEDFSLLTRSGISPAVVITAMTAAFVTGIISLFILVKSSRSKKLKWFAVYCYILAVAAFVYSNFI